ncbi:MAG TPA: nucleoside-diphosphate sugar epimerase/dehydratase [Methylomirabilota bacterium]|nr:nucleoside-diphosphate sugar epimerase/dehydratase [Methylomirabilota bacterium]
MEGLRCVLELADRWRRLIIVVLHVPLLVALNYAALWLRFDGRIDSSDFLVFVNSVPWVVAIRMIVFAVFRLYVGFWRYASIRDVLSICSAVGLSSSIIYIVSRSVPALAGYPRSVLVIDSLLLILALGTLRLTRRIWREFDHIPEGKRVLIYGAGDAGEMIVRDMRQNPLHGYEPIGFFDDDPNKRGRRIHGVKVLGGRDQIARIMDEKRPDAVVLALPPVGAQVVRAIVQSLEGYRIPIQTLPSLGDLLDGKVTVNRIRTLAVEDLLDRSPVRLSVDRVRSLVQGKRVLITGAGGSIGAELARQIGALGPSALVLVDRYENGLHAITLELQSTSVASALETVVADVADRHRIEHVLDSRRPQLIFHAAAHKHVPLMELNPCEAVKNNVAGTRVIAEAAGAVGSVERFVLISTDKAVNPSSVMGATKRVAELLIEALDRSGPVVYTTVRFGNVLASNGSVLPLFLEQIKAGGPVTITHPEMRRYFMLIPEAVHLVLHAAALGQGGDVFVLDMGEQIRIIDLARNVIRLSGFIPEEEIPVKIVGLRPGEKLQEDLVGSDEVATPTSVERILHIESRVAQNLSDLDAEVAALEQFAQAGDQKAVLKKLRELVPTYQPMNGDDGALDLLGREEKRSGDARS